MFGNVAAKSCIVLTLVFIVILPLLSICDRQTEVCHFYVCSRFQFLDAPTNSHIADCNRMAPYLCHIVGIYVVAFS